ncbi:MAG: AraC family transcriptional regulator N-terminal domain-containing protein [Bacteroidota bacterium]
MNYSTKSFYHGEKFVERGTDYPLEFGKLSVYETNTPCRGVKFYFEKNMITLMLSGQKTITAGDLKFEFFPGTLFIPQKHIPHYIDIPNASFTNPTRCLVLDISPDFLDAYTQEIMDHQHEPLPLIPPSSSQQSRYFFSNDQATISCFKRLYTYQYYANGRADEMINTLVLKELILRIFQTEGRYLLLDNCYENISNPHIQRVLLYIKNNLKNKLTIDELARVSELGKTSFFNKFKEIIGMSPVSYIQKERIKQAQSLILDYPNLQHVAFECGFNTYEHFCKSFKRETGFSPMRFKQMERSQHSKEALRIAHP